MPKKSVAEKPDSPLITEPSKDICFTIMPFGVWFENYYESIYCPAIEAANLLPCRADNLYRSSTIINDIWSYTQKAKLILADLTGKNPNVFYELGLAHAITKPAILIAESIDDVPFDLRALRILEYDKNRPSWGEILQGNITNAIKETLKSPLDAVLPTFLSVNNKSKPKTVSEQEMALLEMRKEIDLLRQEFRRGQIRNRGYEPPISPTRVIDPIEAESLIHSFLSVGLSDGVIVDRMHALGAPQKWVLRKLEEERERLNKLNEES